MRNARATVDRPADRAYAGPCTAQVDTLDDPHAAELLRDCGADLYAPPGADVVTCRACGAQYDAPARRAWLLEQARDVLLPARGIARAVDGLGVDIGLGTVKSWVRRDRLVARGQVVIATVAAPPRTGSGTSSTSSRRPPIVAAAYPHDRDVQFRPTCRRAPLHRRQGCTLVFA